MVASEVVLVYFSRNDGITDAAINAPKMIALNIPMIAKEEVERLAIFFKFSKHFFLNAITLSTVFKQKNKVSVFSIMSSSQESIKAQLDKQSKLVQLVKFISEYVSAADKDIALVDPVTLENRQNTKDPVEQEIYKEEEIKSVFQTLIDNTREVKTSYDRLKQHIEGLKTQAVNAKAGLESVRKTLDEIKTEEQSYSSFNESSRRNKAVLPSSTAIAALNVLNQNFSSIQSHGNNYSSNDIVMMLPALSSIIESDARLIINTKSREFQGDLQVFFNNYRETLSSKLSPCTFLHNLVPAFSAFNDFVKESLAALQNNLHSYLISVTGNITRQSSPALDKHVGSLSQLVGNDNSILNTILNMYTNISNNPTVGDAAVCKSTLDSLVLELQRLQVAMDGLIRTFAAVEDSKSNRVKNNPKSSFFSAKYENKISRGKTSGSSNVDVSGPSASALFGSMLFNRPDIKTMLVCNDILTNFKKTLNTSEDNPYVRAITVQKDRMKKRMGALQENLSARTQGSPDEGHIAFQSVKFENQRISAYEQYLKSCQNVVERFVAMNTDFLTKTFRKPRKYMDYWVDHQNAIGEDHKDAAQQVNVYRDNMVATQREVLEAYDFLIRMISADGGMYKPTSTSPESDAQLMHVAELERAHQKFMDDNKNLVVRAYGGELSFMDVVKDSQFLVMHTVKIIRYLIFLTAIYIGSRVFQSLYADIVYAQNKTPPHPIFFVLIITGVDLALSVALFVLLVFLSYVFADPSNGFPINGVMIRRFTFDFFCGSLAVFVVSSWIAYVINKRKYFRYKYEGDRGIRAMEKMLRYLSAIFIFIPYFLM